MIISKFFTQNKFIPLSSALTIIMIFYLFPSAGSPPLSIGVAEVCGRDKVKDKEKKRKRRSKYCCNYLFSPFSSLPLCFLSFSNRLISPRSHQTIHIHSYFSSLFFSSVVFVLLIFNKSSSYIILIYYELIFFIIIFHSVAINSIIFNVWI